MIPGTVVPPHGTAQKIGQLKIVGVVEKHLGDNHVRSAANFPDVLLRVDLAAFAAVYVALV